MTQDEKQVLELLDNGWRLRVWGNAWRLKESGFIASFADVPGGQATINELRNRGRIDINNNLTEAGRLALRYRAEIAA